ncbi:MAG: S8 family peptidase [Paludibacter sp.]|nr:S8 family peptidase [Paludibacter sp.]
MKKLLLLFFWLLISLPATKADTGYYFYVQLKDKNNNPYSLSNPAEFLSQRAIDRRKKFHIDIDSTDLPVSPSYTSEVTATGIMVHSRSKWMNGLTVLTTDSSVMSQIRALSFVKFVQYTGKTTTAFSVISRAKLKTDSLTYGSATTQINIINANQIHAEGYLGQDMIIGVLDAGFYHADQNPGLDSLRLQDRLLGTKDIIAPGNNVFNEDTHGANVLSIMAGNLPGQYLGSAPQASYWLIRTEYAPTEYLVETDFWAAGIEFADSVGVDAINSSLGYTEFDDTTMNYTYADMDGNVSRASRAAYLAARKGIIVCNSAGNEGNDTWHYIGAPADADSIFSVGAVTSNETASYFTSWGPTSDGRVKPEVCAQGSATAYVAYTGTPSSGNGTSYSSPVITGTVTCLMQKYSDKADTTLLIKLANLRNAVISSSNLYLSPSAQLGYGIPDFVKADSLLSKYYATDNENQNSDLVTFINDQQSLTISKTIATNTDELHIYIYTTSGILVYKFSFSNSELAIPVNIFNTGIYIIRITDNKNFQVAKFLIN